MFWFYESVLFHLFSISPFSDFYLYQSLLFATNRSVLFVTPRFDSLIIFHFYFLISEFKATCFPLNIALTSSNRL